MVKLIKLILSSKKNRQINPSFIFLGLAILLGSILRLWAPLTSSMPLNDGGLFYSMINDLIANGFRLPPVTSFNLLNIPMVYPPFSLYLTGILNFVFHIPLLDLLRLLPGLISILTIPAVYLLARFIVKDEFQASFAAFIFALTPTAFDWLIMGGGITRAPGYLFYIIALLFLLRMYSLRKLSDVLLAGVFSALAVISHPEAALHTFISAAVVFAFYGRSKKGVLQSAIVVSLTVLISSPWWFPVLTQQGIQPFLNASNATFNYFSGYLHLFTFDFTEEVALASIGVLALLGIFYLIKKKQFLLPALFLINFLIAPRSAIRYVILALVIMASYALFEIFSFLNQKTAAKMQSTKSEMPLSVLAQVFFAVLLIQWVFSCYYTTETIKSTRTNTTAALQTFYWVRDHTPTNSNFLILTGLHPLLDPFSEWFPGLSERKSIATVQGSEWIQVDGENFMGILTRSTALQKCINRDPACVFSWADKYHQTFDYLVISYQGITQDPTVQSFTPVLVSYLEAKYPNSLVYENGDIFVFKIESTAK